MSRRSLGELAAGGSGTQLTTRGPLKVIRESSFSGESDGR
jgi:hypothetical protein